MSVGAVGRPRRSARSGPARRDLAQWRRHELRDVRHPIRPGLRIEWVIVCPSGVHVVTSLADAIVGRTDETAAPAIVTEACTAADVVAAVLPKRYRDRVRPVLCRPVDVAMAELVGEVLVTSPGTLEHIMAASPVVLSTSEVNDVALRLGAHLEAFPVPRATPGRRRGRRRNAVAGLLAGCMAAAAVLAERAGALPSSW